MTILLIDPFKNTPVVSIEQNEQGRTLNFLDEKFKRGLEITGITLSEKRYGLWRVFPDENPDIFLETFEKDLFNQGLMQKGYYWMSPEDYNNQEKWIENIIKSIFHKE